MHFRAAFTMVLATFLEFKKQFHINYILTSEFGYSYVSYYKEVL